ncbi:protein translocase subunit SecF [Telmatospirillum sp.]|uniref:protein translocase subunit SecF n=1 Tax=Telmatospirillum sp. TaxID=2079197 RepID=UPI00284BF0AB|nr:protein translocase subunit SecF [Telmatospirillum sp.]MDR3435694.1 protein translocase subunit SecF [Telmatospirillum sp.]
MELFRFKRDIPFMTYARSTTVLSAITFVFAVFFLITKGLNFGVEFTGGTVIEVHYQQAAEPAHVQAALEKGGILDSSVQNFGTSSDLIIRMPLKEGASQAQLSETVLGALRAADSNVDLRRVEFIGPQVGKELVTDGSIALALVCAGIMAYLAFRFEWRFALAAIIANMHDVVIILGFFAFFQWEFSLTVLAAVLSVLGYSVNESVVVFDRIRENFRKYKKLSVADTINNAITATMSRTMITHGCTEMVVLSMLLFGGETLHYFAMALTVGIIFGIYSSVLVSSPLVLWMGATRAHFVKVDAAPQAADAKQ